LILLVWEEGVVFHGVRQRRRTGRGLVEIQELRMRIGSRRQRMRVEVWTAQFPVERVMPTGSRMQRRVRNKRTRNEEQRQGIARERVPLGHMALSSTTACPQGAKVRLIKITAGCM